MSKPRAPLAEAIAAYIDKGRLRGHMPGHKGLAAANGLLARWGELAAWDVTEAEGLDDLHDPSGAIAEAQELLARTVGAEQAYFLINGASVGIVASLLAACGRLQAKRPELKPADIRVILPRNAHRAAWHGLALAGCTPVWLPVRYNGPKMSGLALGTEPEQLGHKLGTVTNVGAALFVQPSYYGVCVDLAQMLALCREKGVISVVDEAHGAHFAFVQPERGAARLGADLVIDSWHKSLGSLGQTAVLLANNRELEIKRWLDMLQTTSPSYPLLASLDVVRAEWSLYGRKRAEKLRRVRERLREIVAELALLRLVEPDILPAGFGYDETKALLYSEYGHSGWQIAEALRQGGIEPELADWRFALLLLSYADAEADAEAERWRRALQQADALLSRETAAKLDIPAGELALPETVLTPGEAIRRRVAYLPLGEAGGRIAAELLTPYPPGIPWVGPGERISSEIVAGLQAVLAGGGRVQGLHDPNGLHDADKLVAVLA